IGCGMSDPKSQPEINLSLIDLKALREPAVKLIETVRDAVGVLYEPRRIVKRAQAESEANIIRAEGEVMAQGVAQRARRRIEWQEMRRQENIEGITKLALKYLPDNVESEPVDPDWTVRFFQSCADVSDEQMQSLWATLLASEVAKPGTYSPRTLSVVQDMRSADAHAFTKFATFVWRAKDETSREWFPMLRTYEDNFARVGLTFDDLIQLEALGLIRIDYMQGFFISLKPNQIVAYYDKSYRVRLDNPNQKPNHELDIGECVLTQSGQELAPIAGGRPNPEYCQRVLGLWSNQGITVEVLSG